MADTPDIPVVKKIAIGPIQQRIAAVNEDRTLSFALHGELNRVIKLLVNTSNYNAETIQLVVDALAKIGVIVSRVDAVEVSQAAAAAEQALVNSYTDPTTVVSAQNQSDGTATLTIINHNRVYADATKTTVAVQGATLTGLQPNSQYYIYYDDAARTGGTVTYHATTNNVEAAQSGIRHSLGGIATADADVTDTQDGGGVSPPGAGQIPPWKRKENPAIDPPET